MQVALALVVVFAAVVDDPPTEKTEKTEKAPEKAEKAEPKKKPSSSTPPLQEAEAALRAGIHKRCVEFAQEALATGLLDEDGVARAWWTRGRCHSIDGDKDRAERSYAVAVRVKPTILMPVDDAVFEKVKPEGTAPETALSLTATAVVVDPSLVAVELAVVDDLALGKTFLLLDSDEREVARAPLERKDDATGDAWTRIKHRFSGIPVEGLTARLLDKHGNVLRRAAVVVDDAARKALVAAGATPVTTSPTTSTTTTQPVTALSYVGGATALAGFVGAAATGIALAISTQGDEDDVTDNNAIDSEMPLLIGFFGGVAVAVIGGVLVVVDQVPQG